MARVKGGTVSRARRKKVLKLAKGYFGSKHTLYKTANEQVMHSFRYAYNDRRKLKGNMRKIWITRINAAARMNDFIEAMDEVAIVEKKPSKEGNTMSTVLAPKKK